MPKIKPPKFSQRYYSYTVLLAPEKLGNSPQLDLALSLLRMEYPKDQAQAFHDMLYGQTSLDAYKDLVINEQRKNYRGRAADMPSNGDSTASSNWRYTEKFSIKKIYDRGIVIERNLETYSGGTNSGRITQYYNIEIDTDGFRQLSLDDLFANYQEDQKLRDIVYEELREYSNLGSGQPLSQGIYLKNQPELTFNFFITVGGLGLHWDPAQIAPYSHGSIQINLPWYMVRSLMLYTGIELLTKFNIYLFM
jgi:hypothetical protein